MISVQVHHECELGGRWGRVCVADGREGLPKRYPPAAFSGIRPRGSFDTLHPRRPRSARSCRLSAVGPTQHSALNVQLCGSAAPPPALANPPKELLARIQGGALLRERLLDAVVARALGALDGPPTLWLLGSQLRTNGGGPEPARVHPRGGSYGSCPRGYSSNSTHLLAD